MATAFTVASWNVEHFKDDSNRMERVIRFLTQNPKFQTPDIFGIYEVVGKNVYETLTTLLPDYTFYITYGPQSQEILVGARSNLSVFFTQKTGFQSGVQWMRPGAAVTVKIDGQLVYSRIIYRSWETTIDVSEYMSETNFYRVTVEIQYGGYRQWSLVYLGIERSEAKYVPITLQLTLSFDWNPDSSYLDDFVLGLREFADHAWDAYEDQLIITKIDIYKNSVMWYDANIRCHLDNDFPPHATMTYSIDGQGNPIKGTLRGLQFFDLPKYWPHYLTTWTTWQSYLAITHEMSHAFFHLADEYEKDNPYVECRNFWEAASIMDASVWPFPKTEFCVRTNHDPDEDTAQTWWWWGWSCWETFTYFNPEMYEPFTVYDNIFDDVAANYVEIVIH